MEFGFGKLVQKTTNKFMKNGKQVINQQLHVKNIRQDVGRANTKAKTPLKVS